MAEGVAGTGLVLKTKAPEVTVTVYILVSMRRATVSRFAHSRPEEVGQTRQRPYMHSESLRSCTGSVAEGVAGTGLVPKTKAPEVTVMEYVHIYAAAPSSLGLSPGLRQASNGGPDLDARSIANKRGQ